MQELLCNTLFLNVEAQFWINGIVRQNKRAEFLTRRNQKLGGLCFEKIHVLELRLLRQRREAMDILQYRWSSFGTIDDDTARPSALCTKKTCTWRRLCPNKKSWLELHWLVEWFNFPSVVIPHVSKYNWILYIVIGQDLVSRQLAPNLYPFLLCSSNSKVGIKAIRFRK